MYVLGAHLNHYGFLPQIVRSVILISECYMSKSKTRGVCSEEGR